MSSRVREKGGFEGPPIEADGPYWGTMPRLVAQVPRAAHPSRGPRARRTHHPMSQIAADVGCGQNRRRDPARSFHCAILSFVLDHRRVTAYVFCHLSLRSSEGAR